MLKGIGRSQQQSHQTEHADGHVIVRKCTLYSVLLVVPADGITFEDLLQ